MIFFSGAGWGEAMRARYSAPLSCHTPAHGAFARWLCCTVGASCSLICGYVPCSLTIFCSEYLSSSKLNLWMFVFFSCWFTTIYPIPLFPLRGLLLVFPFSVSLVPFALLVRCSASFFSMQGIGSARP